MKKKILYNRHRHNNSSGGLDIFFVPFLMILYNTEAPTSKSKI